MNILVIDDVGAASPLVPPLLRAGHNVRLERSRSQSCRQALADLRPELVIVELGTPGYDGDTAWRARHALQDVWPQEPTVLAVSGLPAADTRFRSELISARLTLHEPFSPDDVVDLLQHVGFARARVAACRET